MAQRILRPLTNISLIDEVFDLYKRHFVLLFSISLVVTIPYFLTCYGVHHRPFWTYLLTTPIMTIQSFAITYAVSCSYLGRNVDMFSAYRHVLRTPLSLLATMLIAYVMFYIGFILCVVPGVIFGFWIVFVAPVFVVEGMKYYPAIQRSRQLAAGHWGRIFVVMLCAVSAFLIANYVLRLPVDMLTGGSYSYKYIPNNTIGLLNRAVVSALATPITLITTVLLYYDIRVRKEGFDIEMLARDLDSAPEAPVL